MESENERANKIAFGEKAVSGEFARVEEMEHVTELGAAPYFKLIVANMMTDEQLNRLHRVEQGQGYILVPTIITSMFRLQPIKAYYRVTSNNRSGRTTDRVLREWSDRVHAVLARFRDESGFFLGAIDITTQHAFDRALWSSDADFYFRTATVSKRTTGWRTAPEEA